jgi:hypothetical protein
MSSFFAGRSLSRQSTFTALEFMHSIKIHMTAHHVVLHLSTGLVEFVSDAGPARESA